MGDIDSFLKEV